MGGAKKIRLRVWAQFTDDAAIVSSDVKGVQALVNIFTGVHLGFLVMEHRQMLEIWDGESKNVQTLLDLWVDGMAIPVIPHKIDYCYLEKSFSFDLDNNAAEDLIIKN